MQMEEEADAATNAVQMKIEVVKVVKRTLYR